MIATFKHDYRFLSNFYMCNVFYEGLLYPSSEHAYQASKSNNPKIRQFILELKTPTQAKREGGNIRVRKGFDKIKISNMKEILLSKFTTNLMLGKRLIDTLNHVLVEGNIHHDNFWGICCCDHCGNKTSHNHLGKLLMEVRDEVKLFSKTESELRADKKALNKYKKKMLTFDDNFFPKRKGRK